MRRLTTAKRRLLLSSVLFVSFSLLHLNEYLLLSKKFRNPNSTNGTNFVFLFIGMYKLWKSLSSFRAFGNLVF